VKIRNSVVFVTGGNRGLGLARSEVESCRGGAQM
jgi:hypothetical protein